MHPALAWLLVPILTGSASAPKPGASFERRRTEATEKAQDPKAIRAVDLDQLFATDLGAVDLAEVAYADLTGDGKEEAVVPLASGGTAGHVAIAVFGYDEAGILRPLLLHQGVHLRFQLPGKALVILEPVYGPDDPNCCPSGQARMVYAWNGKALVLKEKKAGPMPGK